MLKLSLGQTSPSEWIFLVLFFINNINIPTELTAARLAQLGERRSAEREVVSSNPGRTINQGL